jgi:hypothetical protein
MKLTKIVDQLFKNAKHKKNPDDESKRKDPVEEIVDEAERKILGYFLTALDRYGIDYDATRKIIDKHDPREAMMRYFERDSYYLVNLYGFDPSKALFAPAIWNYFEKKADWWEVSSASPGFKNGREGGYGIGDINKLEALSCFMDELSLAFAHSSLRKESKIAKICNYEKEIYTQYWFRTSYEGYAGVPVKVIIRDDKILRDYAKD